MNQKKNYKHYRDKSPANTGLIIENQAASQCDDHIQAVITLNLDN